LTAVNPGPAYDKVSAIEVTLSDASPKVTPAARTLHSARANRHGSAKARVQPAAGQRLQAAAPSATLHSMAMAPAEM